MGLRILAVLAILGFLATLSGCGASMPVRTGYDRRTGTWKPAPGSKSRKVAAKGAASPGIEKDSDDTDVTDSVATIGLKIRGQASFYGKELAGSSTSSGELFDPDASTCAHRTLPFGTRLKITYLKKSTSTVVRVNDRGPHKDDRILDLSRAAADDLGLTADGVGTVEAEVVP
jgi:rare lipoprotein A